MVFPPVTSPILQGTWMEFIILSSRETIAPMAQGLLCQPFCLHEKWAALLKTSKNLGIPYLSSSSFAGPHIGDKENASEMKKLGNENPRGLLFSIDPRLKKFDLLQCEAEILRLQKTIEKALQLKMSFTASVALLWMFTSLYRLIFADGFPVTLFLGIFFGQLLSKELLTSGSEECWGFSQQRRVKFCNFVGGRKPE